MIDWLLIACIALGHVAIFVAWINRMHGTATPRVWLKVVDVIWHIGFFGLPLLAASIYLRTVMRGESFDWNSGLGRAALVYGGCCLLAATIGILHRAYRLATPQETDRLAANHTRVSQLAQTLGHRPTAGPLATTASWLPWNEILHLSRHEKQLTIDDLPTALQQLTITHLSDLHFTGQLTPAFYNEVVDQANAFGSDLIVITGDILEKRKCLPWVQETLGRLSAACGVYFVLGNHELRLRDEQLARDTLTDAGLQDLGGKWVRVEYQGHPLVLAGNELPWFRPAPDMDSCPAEFDGKVPLRIAVCHTPDQLSWARRHRCQLMLAGHTHGGQVRLPLIGPILAPSVFGTRHASGTFYHPPTLLHVSRGLAGTRPIRFRCRPEITQLILVG